MCRSGYGIALLFSFWQPMKSVSEQRVLKGAETFAIVVVYEDTSTRDRCIRICDHLETELGREIDFVFSWWKFDYLGDPFLSAEATAAAAQSDMVIVSAHAGGKLPSTVEAWIEAWTAKRNGKPGALVALVGMVEDPMTGLTPRHYYLKNVAERVGMDYLHQEVVVLPEVEYESIENVLRRAEQRTPLMEQILQQQQPMRHWGINE
jgi:hypothetical protein